MKKEIGLWNNSDWDCFARGFLKTYGGDLINNNHKDIKNYCPNYNSLAENEKIEFWIFFLSCMAKYESGFKPNCEYEENFKDRHGDYIISRGLFQTSVESMRSYGYRDSRYDIHLPPISIKWTVIILDRLVGKDKRIAGYKRKWYGKKIYFGGARYWSVLRNNSRHENIKKLCKEYSEKKKYEGKTAYEIMQGEIGVKEIAGKKNNPRVIEYMMGASNSDSDTAWCSFFMKWGYAEAGIILKEVDGYARSWRMVGKLVIEPREGDIAIFWRKKIDSKYGHVANFVGFTKDGNILCLGGNQSGMVCIKEYPKERVLEFRRFS